MKPQEYFMLSPSLSFSNGNLEISVVPHYVNYAHQIIICKHIANFISVVIKSAAHSV